MYTPARPPLAHQVRGREKLAHRPSRPSSEDVWAWLMEMGTGKSQQVCDEWGERVEAGDLQDLAVVAPAGSYRNWFLDRDGIPSELTQCLAPELRARTVLAPWVSGGGARVKAQLSDMLRHRDGPRALFMNVEALSTVPRAREVLREFLSARRALLAWDESTTIMTPGVERTRQALAIGPLAAARRILTGLPTPRSPMNLFTQFQFLDWRILGHRSYYSFRARYAIMERVNFGGRKVWLEVGYRNVGELHDLIEPYSFRCLKEECLDLPPKTYALREVPLTEEQARAYRELRAYATTQIDSGAHVTATAVITQNLRILQMLCGHVVDEEGRTHEVPTRRDGVLLDVLGEYGGKAIIWVPFDNTLRRLVGLLTKEFGQGSTAAFWGGNRSTRSEEEARWLTYPACRFIVATPGAGGRGNNWTPAGLVVYYANTHNLEERLQSEDRPHRQGLDHPVTYVDLYAPETREFKTIQALRAKIDMAATITGENYREWLI